MKSEMKYKKSKNGHNDAVAQNENNIWKKVFPFVAGALILVIVALTAGIVLVNFGALDNKKDDLSVYAPKTESDERYSEGSYRYAILSDGNAMIVGLTDDAEDTELYIPSEIGGRTVTAIGDSSFYMDTEIVRVVIPEGVTYIGSRAFFGCVNIETLSLPSTLGVIRESAFEFCDYLDGISFAGTCDMWSAVKIGENNPIGYVSTLS